MSGFDDLGTALREDAEKNAPRADAFDVDALTRAARARRAPRLWATGALGATAVLGLGALVLTVPSLTAPMLLAGGASSADESTTLQSADGGEVSEEAAGDGDLVAPLECGTSLSTLRSSRPSSTLTLTLGDLALESVDDSSIAASGVLEFKNASQSDVTLEGYGSPDVVLVDEFGTIVATTTVRGSVGLDRDIPSGGTTTVSFASTVTPCEGAPSLMAGDDLAAVAVFATIVSEPEAVELE